MRIRSSIPVVLLALATPAVAQRFEPRGYTGLRWFKGNTHAHTTESDGDSAPEVVARWYRDHGYHFLVLSDHNVFTDPERFRALVDSAFILIGGEEVTSSFESTPVHVNGLDIRHVIAPRRDSTLAGTIQANVDAVREERGVPHINHPNFGWAFGTRELLQVRNDRLLEIWNGHPTVHNEGGGGSPSVEAVWDDLLTAGKRIYGIAVDDAHHFRGEFSRNRANPGRGWIVVRAAALDARELMRSLEDGLFYASTGVELDDVTVDPLHLNVRIHPNQDFRYTTTFIGDSGRVLARVPGSSATLDLGAIERAEALTYVRARVDDSGGARAWVQPVFLVRDGTARAPDDNTDPRGEALARGY
ncbi:MAG: CehA/McbA family metallohydrolase [Gemmatimonadota bacterium]|jgi:hypothetical protein